MLAAVSTQGWMSLKDVKKECCGEGWVPLIIYHVEHEGEMHTVLPLFSTEDVCKRWCKRNLPKEWGLSGGVYLTEADVPAIDSKGWRIKLFDWPNLVKKIVEFEVMPFELNDKPSISVK